MQNKNGSKRSRRSAAIVGAVGTLAGAMCGLVTPSHANAVAINVALANAAIAQNGADVTAFGANNHSITPFTYGNASAPTNYGTGATVGGGSFTTPVQVTTIPDAPSVSYDAADTTDSGIHWNSLQAMNSNLAANTTAVTYILEEQNVPLVDSGGNSTGVTLNQYLRLPNNKGTADAVRLFQNGTTAGSDGLLPNPISSLNSASTAGDGYGTGNAHFELMGTGWSLNGTTEGLGFTLMGLTPSAQYNLYLYSGATTLGQGGNFTGVSTILTDANGTTTGGTASGTAVQTNQSVTTNFRSVFDGTGINPAPELGKSWNLLTLSADASGDLSFALTGASAGTIKPILNGFQLDPVAVPEPTSAVLLGVGGLLLLKRRRPESAT